MKKPTTEQIEDWKRRVGKGEYIKAVARGSGFSSSTVGRYTADVAKPFEHRGRWNKRP